MALIRKPFAVQPAFNEIDFIDDEATELMVEEIEPGRGRSVTMHRVQQNGKAVFDIKNFVSKLFYDETVPIDTPNIPGWAFRDYNLFCRYAVAGEEFAALNAVVRKGETLDLLDEGDAPLTLRPIRNNRIMIPTYEGYPVGVSVMVKVQYDPNPNGYIEIEVDATSGSFIIPFASVANNGVDYSFNVFVNGTHVGVATGTTSVNGTGYELNGLTGDTATIMLRPNGPAVAGWGRSFGYYSGYASGCNTTANKNKLIRIINDPDFAHLLTAIDTGDSFRYSQYGGCTALVEVPEETLPDSVQRLGAQYRMQQYMGCKSLSRAAREKINDKIVEIPDFFRDQQYYSSGVTEASPEVLSDKITNIGNSFRSSMYALCPLLIAPNEFIPDTIITIGDGFRSRQYGSTKIQAPAVEVLPPGVTNIGNNFRSNMYRSAALVSTTPEVLPPGVTNIGDNFRFGQYYGNPIQAPAVEVLPAGVTTIGSGFREIQYGQTYYAAGRLISTAKEVLPASVVNIGARFRYGQYGMQSMLNIGSHIHSFRFAELLNQNAANYKEMFYLNSAKTTADVRPKYYTNEAETTTTPITTLTPTAAKAYLTNRTGITGYSSLNANWK